jgi:hypothetical protein
VGDSGKCVTSNDEKRGGFFVKSSRIDRLEDNPIKLEMTWRLDERENLETSVLHSKNRIIWSETLQIEGLRFGVLRPILNHYHQR